MNYFPHQHAKRKGAKQTAVCDLCGQWTDIQDLVQCDVQGLRGFWVCSSHPWEARIRFKPSWLDRGGVSQVADPSGGMLPGPGGFFWDMGDEVMISAIKTTDQTVTGSTLTADTQLTINLTLQPHWFRLVLYGTPVNNYKLALSGTVTATSFLACGIGTNSTPATALGAEIPHDGTDSFIVVEGTITPSATGSFGVYFAETSPTFGAITKAGSYIIAAPIS